MNAEPPSPAFAAAHEILALFWEGIHLLREREALRIEGEEGRPQEKARDLYFKACENRVCIGTLETINAHQRAALLRCYADIEAILLQYL